MIKTVLCATGAVVWGVPLTVAGATFVGYLFARPRVLRGETVVYTWGKPEPGIKKFTIKYRPCEKGMSFVYQYGKPDAVAVERKERD